MRYIEVLSDPQGLRLLSKRPCQHSSCFWAKASKPMKIKAARIHPATTFFTMTATPRGLAHCVVGDDDQDDDRHGRGSQCAARPIEPSADLPRLYAHLLDSTSGYPGARQKQSLAFILQRTMRE